MSDELRAAIQPIINAVAWYGEETADDHIAWHTLDENGPEIRVRDLRTLAALALPSSEVTAGGEDGPLVFTPDIPFDVQADPEAFEWRRKSTGWDEARRLRAALAALLADWDGLHSDETHCPYCGLDWYDRLFIHSDDCPVPVARAALSAAPESGIPIVSTRTRPPLTLDLGDFPESAPDVRDAEARVRDWRPVSHAIHETLLAGKWVAYDPGDFAFLTLALCGEVGELANVVKKMQRGDWGPIGDLWIAPGIVDVSDELRWKLTEELADVLADYPGLAQAPQ